MMMLLGLLRGLVMIGLGLEHNLAITLILFTAFGVSMGYTSVLFMTWMQLRVEISILGRMMSVFMFAMMGILPISMALAGWAIDWFSLDNMFAIAGFAMVLTAIVGCWSPSIRLLGYSDEEASAIRGHGR